MWALARSYFFFLWDLECCRQAEMPGDHFCCKMVKILLLSFKHDFFMYKCDWFFFLHFCLLCATLFTRQLKWPLWAILCRCEADFSCVVTLRQEVRARLRSHPSSADHLHQLSKAKSDRSNGFCVIYAEEPALCHPLGRTWRSQGRCSLPGWSNVPPAQALQSCSVACAMSTCIYTSTYASSCRFKPVPKLLQGPSSSTFPCISQPS